MGRADVYSRQVDKMRSLSSEMKSIPQVTSHDVLDSRRQESREMKGLSKILVFVACHGVRQKHMSGAFLLVSVEDQWGCSMNSRRLMVYLVYIMRRES